MIEGSEAHGKETMLRLTHHDEFFRVFAHVHILQRVHDERRGEIPRFGHVVARLIAHRPVYTGVADVSPAFQAVYPGFRREKLRLVPHCDVPSALFLYHMCKADSSKADNTRFQSTIHGSNRR